LLSGLLCFEAMPVVQAQNAQPLPKLNIVIVEGDGAVNNIRQRTAREPIVQVEDENHRPIAGAVVIFTLPSDGAGGVFANASRTLMVLTDSQGRAVAAGLKPNAIPGNMQIQVDASYQGGTGHTVVNQKNILKNAARVSILSTKVLIIVAVAGAAIAAGAVCATACGGGKSSTVITAGAGTVGAPH
jgi:hypothetical protein